MHPYAGSKLRTDLLRDAGVTSVASTASAAKEAQALLGGMEEQVCVPCVCLYVALSE